MHRSVVVLVGFLMAPFTLAAGQPGTKPAWQRSLTGEDKHKAEQLEKQLEQLQAAGTLPDALKAAEKLATLRSHVQGDDHWETVTARFAVTAIRSVLQHTSEQKDYARSFRLARQADSLSSAGRYTEAAPLLQQVLTIRRNCLGDNHPITALAYLNLASNLEDEGKYTEAEQNNRKALAIYLKTLGEDHPDTATGYDNLANVLTTESKYHEAELDLRKALAIRLKALGEDHNDTATSYSNLAMNLNAQARYPEAEVALRKSLGICTKVNGTLNADTAISHNNLAFNLQSQGKYAEAELHYRQALAIKRRVLGEQHPGTATGYDNLSAILSVQGKHADAGEGLRKALAIRRKILGENHPDTALSYSNVAFNLEMQGRYEEAEEGYRKALAIRRKVLGEKSVDTAFAYTNLALVLITQGKFIEAEAPLRQALAIRRQLLGDAHPETARSYVNLGADLHRQQKYAEAAAYIRQAVAIMQKALPKGHPDIGAAYNNLAVSLQALGRLQEAETVLRQALAIYTHALGAGHPETGKTHHNLAANLDAQARYPEAEQHYRQALAIRRKALGDDHPDTAASGTQLAHILHVQGKDDEAALLLRQAARAFDCARLHIAASGLERIAGTSQQSPLPLLAAVLARHGNQREAGQAFEQSLARGVWDDLTARLRRTPSERAKQTRLTDHIHRLNKLLAAPALQQPTAAQQKRRQQLLTNLGQAQDGLAAFTHQLEKKYGPVAGQVYDLKQIQAALPDDTALVAWLDLPTPAKAADLQGDHWAFLLRSSGDPVWVRLHGSGANGAWTDDDIRLPNHLRSALLSPDSRWQELAERLRRQRLEPLAKYLEGARGHAAVHRLIVLPSTALAGVPVEAFADPYTVSYAHSGTMYAYLRGAARPASQGLLALADPVFESPDHKRPQSRQGDNGVWPRLPGTRIEVAALQQLFGQTATLLLASEASEQRLNALSTSGELGRYRYVHLATHGEVDNVLPLRSAVILAGDHLPDARQRTALLLSGQAIPDGRLTAEEVLNRWNLDCELVTLSACQTALGKYEAGEGFIGFAQALVLSGSRSVCLSLWKVDDTATALLMQRFYQNLLGKRPGLEKPLSKTAALAEAKHWLRTLPRSEALKHAAACGQLLPRGKRPALPPLTETATPATPMHDDYPYAHPYYWAAFVLIGNDG